MVAAVGCLKSLIPDTRDKSQSQGRYSRLPLCIRPPDALIRNNLYKTSINIRQVRINAAGRGSFYSFTKTYYIIHYRLILTPYLVCIHQIISVKIIPEIRWGKKHGIQEALASHRQEGYKALCHPGEFFDYICSNFIGCSECTDIYYHFRLRFIITVSILIRSRRP